MSTSNYSATKKKSHCLPSKFQMGRNNKQQEEEGEVKTEKKYLFYTLKDGSLPKGIAGVIPLIDVQRPRGGTYEVSMEKGTLLVSVRLWMYLQGSRLGESWNILEDTCPCLRHSSIPLNGVCSHLPCRYLVVASYFYCCSLSPWSPVTSQLGRYVNCLRRMV